MQPIIELKNIVTKFGTQTVHKGVSLSISPGEIYGLIGASGSGKSVLLRIMLGLLKPQGGSVTILGKNIDKLSFEERKHLSFDMGVSFQSGALFSSLTVGQNIMMPMKEHLNLSSQQMTELTYMKLDLVGLPPNAFHKYPAELSGGMKKRVGVARALALDPKVLLLDEPTAGLDAISAEGFDQLIKTLQKSLGISIVIVTHDIDTLFAICDKIAVLVDKKIQLGTIDELLALHHPWIDSYFGGQRGRQAMKSKQG